MGIVGSNFKMVILLAMVAVLAQCGGKKSRSAEAASWSTLPGKPIVILGPTVRNGNEIQGPWFEFRFQVSNNDGESSFTIVAFEVEVTGTDDLGSPMVTNVSLTPSMFNKTLKDSNGNEVQCEYFTFGTFAPGAKNEDLDLGNVSPCAGGTPVFVIGNLGKKKVGANYRYKVKVRPLGWFGDYLKPTDRFDMTFNFSTQ